MKERYRIGCSYYDITYHKVLRNLDDKQLLGEIDHDGKVIRICSRYCKQTQLQVKFHESTHGIFHEYGIDGDEDEITVMSSAFWGLIIDNPILIKAILKYAEGIKC